MGLRCKAPNGYCSKLSKILPPTLALKYKGKNRNRFWRTGLGANLSPHVALHFFGLGHYESRLHVCLATYLSCDSYRLRVGSRYLPTYLPSRSPLQKIAMPRGPRSFSSLLFGAPESKQTLVLIFLLFFSSVKGLWIVVLPLQPTFCCCLVFFSPLLVLVLFHWFLLFLLIFMVSDLDLICCCCCCCIISCDQEGGGEVVVVEEEGEKEKKRREGK